MKPAVALLLLTAFRCTTSWAETDKVFVNGDTVTLTTDSEIRFKDKYYRMGIKGEVFTVYSHSFSTHKVYFLTTNAEGQKIGLNVSDEALVSAEAQPPIAIGSNKELHDTQPKSPVDATDKAGLSDEIPAEVVKRIKRIIALKNPDETKLQDFLIQHQLKAYQWVNSFSDPKLPPDVWKTIRRTAEIGHPDDYGTQKYVIEDHVKSFYWMESHREEDMPAGVLDEIKQRVRIDYPNDYSDQQNVARKNIMAYYWLRDLKIDGISDSQLTALKMRARESNQNNYLRQQYSVQSDLKAILRVE